jgi:putative addiction module component (TIGR02574 family)
MTKRTDDLLTRAAQLTATERIELVEELLASLDQPDPEIDRLWAREAEDRLAAFRRGEIGAVELDAVLAKYRAA